MINKPLLAGLAGFFLGGFIVALAATTFDKPDAQSTARNSSDSQVHMSDMTASLVNKNGDNFDRAFLAEMVSHHQDAIDMSTLAQTHAKHNEVKQLASDIIGAQTSEITAMKTWQTQWNYTTQDSTHSMHNMDTQPDGL